MNEKPLLWIHGEVKTPPMTLEARRELGMLLRDVQEGDMISMPHSRPMPAIGPRCHELRVKDERNEWRLIYRIDPDFILILDVFNKTTRETPQRVIKSCQKRLKQYEDKES